MSLKKITEDPKITDTIIFELETVDSDDCAFTPYKIDTITIYYVERDFLSSNFGEYESVKFDPSILANLKEAEISYCADPSAENLFALNQLTSEIEATAQRNTFYYKDASIVHKFGTSSDPAWASVDPEASGFVKLITEDSDGNAQVGHFEFEWTPSAKVREGDYFICWTWTPLIAGDSLSNHIQFSLFGDQRVVTSIPTHQTVINKYERLTERYLPEMYKMTLTDSDITPEVTDKLNLSIAKGFKFIEDYANQIIDLYDANALHESLLVYLSNLFNLRLKSSDPTLWRRQIKEAITLFKKKGTLEGLQMAFSQAGMTLDKITQLWQVTSDYTWTESFLVESSATFRLSKIFIGTIDTDNFGLWVRRQGETEYTELDESYIEFTETPCGLYSEITWIGDELSVNPLNLYSGDIIKVMYQYKAIPTSRQAVEDYIRTLPLADKRDETDQAYPPKNWNVRLIEEDDPLIDTVISVRHPFHDPVVFGKIRTEFPYSENIYNMDEFNGSTRDSFDPCFIDKTFVDPCGSGISSKYNIDLTVENLCDERIQEIYDILREYTPFHSVVHGINFSGEVNEYVNSPVEEIDFLVKFDFSEYVISGNNNEYFSRTMENGLSTLKVTRDQLAAQTTIVSNKTGTGYNSWVGIVSTRISLNSLGVIPGLHVLKVLAPSGNSGEYQISQISNNTARIDTTVIEPLDESEFTFTLSNILYQTSVAKIYQQHTFEFSAVDVDFSQLGVKTLWDIDNTPDFTGGTWKILITAYSPTAYDIISIINGVLILEDHGDTLPIITTTGITYSLVNESDVIQNAGSTGSLVVTHQGKVDLNDSNIVDLSQYSKVGYYVLYDGVEYLIGETDQDYSYIEDYSDGDAIGVNIEIRVRLVEQSEGFFSYSGINLRTNTDHEAEFGITNGDNPPITDEDQMVDNNLRKENFLIKIGDDYYKIIGINESTIQLGGLPQDWGLYISGGTLVNYSIHWFEKNEVTTQLMEFDQLDRDGKDVIVREIESTLTNDIAVMALMMPQGNDISENVQQEESVSFVIEYRDGTTQKGDL